MAKQGSKGSTKKPIEQYEHKDKKRANIPPVGLVTPQTDPIEPAQKSRKQYQYDPHLDPQLVWAGKAERTSFEIPTVSLHVHERIDPRTIMEAVKAKNGNSPLAPSPQLSLFALPDENRPLREEFPFYDHKKPLGWKNRLIAGDSLLVMNSLLEKEGLGGQVQMVYIDPPYGIRYGSNFQPFTNKRDVKDGADDDLTLEPETLKAFRDTWELGIHSYLTYLRDRLLLAKDLLHESGSCFVQISDENIHHVREMLDEVFGVGNFIGLIAVTKTGSLTGDFLSSVADYLLWYGKDRARTKYRKLFDDRAERDEEDFNADPLKSDGFRKTTTFDYKFNGQTFLCKSNEHWKVTKEGLDQSFLQPDPSIARQGETLRQSEWRTELLKTGIRAKGGTKMEFVRVEPLPGTRWLSADAEVRDDQAKAQAGSRRAVVSFGPEHAPLEQRQVAEALEEAQTLVPKPSLVIFAALQFDPEASKDVDETRWPGVTMLKAQMNGDLVT